MALIEKHIDVDVPVRTAYNQWTQFESFPRFMEGVEQVRQLDDAHLHWRANVGGSVRSGTPSSPSRRPTSASPGAACPAPQTPGSSPSIGSATTGPA
jgi:hypothetical protein